MSKEKNYTEIEGILTEQKDSVKLIKYSRGFGYEIKAHGTNMEKIVQNIKKAKDNLDDVIGEE